MHGRGKRPHARWNGSIRPPVLLERRGLIKLIAIDDERDFGPTFEIIRTLPEGLARLERVLSDGEHVDELWLDHDLGFNPTSPEGWDTIMPVVNWLEENAHHGITLDIDRVVVHTANPGAARVMMTALTLWYDTVKVTL